MKIAVALHCFLVKVEPFMFKCAIAQKGILTMDYIAIAQQHIAELYPVIMYMKPLVKDLPPGAILGTWQYSIPGKKRYILAPDMELAAGVLPGDVARAWVKDEYNLPLRRRKSQLERGYTVPLYAKRGSYGQCGYVDIKGAYLKILSLGYNLEYILGKYIGCDPRPVPTQIAGTKFCYSIAVSMSASPISNLTVMGKEGTFIHRPMNLFSNPCLFNLAQDTLNGIGTMILSELGEHVHYANTDGYIVDEEYIDETISIIRQWGFDAALKHYGQAEIRGVASWRVGTKETRRFDARAVDFSGRFMDIEHSRWLLKRWEILSSKLTSLY